MVSDWNGNSRDRFIQVGPNALALYVFAGPRMILKSW
jgi:hypothetical protein